MRFGITLAHTHTSIWEQTATLAEDVGFESVWLPDHLVFPLGMAGTPYADGGEPPVPPETPLFDAPAYLSYLAARTTRVRLGTFVYLLGLRHPLVTARGFATADILSGGRIEVGVGAGWLESEWCAAGLDPTSRGRLLDESIGVVRRLWTEEMIEHRGEQWRWDPVRFEPKPAQSGGPPILVGGESLRALRRAARLGDGWMSMPHADLATVRSQIAILHDELRRVGRDARTFEVTACILQPPPPAEIDDWATAGVHRMIVKPWQRTRDTLAALESFGRSYHGVMDQ